MIQLLSAHSFRPFCIERFIDAKPRMRFQDSIQPRKEPRPTQLVVREIDELQPLHLRKLFCKSFQKSISVASEPPQIRVSQIEHASHSKSISLSSISPERLTVSESGKHDMIAATNASFLCEIRFGRIVPSSEMQRFRIRVILVIATFRNTKISAKSRIQRPKLGTKQFES